MNKDKYKSLVSGNPSLPIFLQPWWLDTVVENHSWDVVFVEEESLLKACFIYVLKKKGPFKSIGMPGLTPYLGFWFNNKVNQGQVDQLMSRLPKHDKFYIKLHYKLANLELNKSGYNQEQLHTYVLTEIKNHDSLYSGFRSTLRGTIKKAKETIRIVETNDVKILYALCEMSFNRQSKEVDFSFELVNKIYNAVMARNCGTILMAEDGDGNIHAATMLVWDLDSAYYLLNGGDPKFRSGGANSVLMWEIGRAHV